MADGSTEFTVPAAGSDRKISGALRDVRDELDDLAGFYALDWAEVRPALRRLSEKLRQAQILMARPHE